MHYKHTQIGYLMIFVTLIVSIFFIWSYILAQVETPSYNSGTNFAVTSLMVLIIFVLASFSTLEVSIDGQYLQIKFGYGLYKKRFLLSDIKSAKAAKNPWYCGYGIRVWFWPKKMIIYNVSGHDAVEIALKNGNTYRIGTDEPEKLEQAINNFLK